MGQSLAIHYEWSIQTPSRAPLNQQLVSDVQKLIDTVCQQYPEESKAEFKKPFQYATKNLKADLFQNNPYFTLTPNLKSAVVASITTRSDSNAPVFVLDQNQTTQVLTVKVSTFEALQKVLNVLPADRKSAEIHDMLQVCAFPISNIIGCDSKDPSHYYTEVTDAIKGEGARKEQASSSLKLLSLFSTHDLKNVPEAVRLLAADKKLNVNAVEQEFFLLKTLAGREASKPLSLIDWDTDFLFANGARSPPWRQSEGELGYLEVRLHDREKLVVTARQDGYFVNKGYSKDSQGNEVINYEAASQTYPCLVDLLKAQSKHFASIIDRPDLQFSGKKYGDFSLVKLASEKNDSRKSAGSAKKTKTNTKTVNSKPNDVAETAEKANNEAADKQQSENAEDDAESEFEDELKGKRQESFEPTSEYWQIQKLTKYLRIGNQTATVIGICALRDCDLHQEANQLAIRDLGALEILVNLLDTEDSRCITGSLLVLRDISQNAFIRVALCEMNSIQSLVNLLDYPSEEINCLTAETLAHCAKNGMNRKLIRKYGGIKKLVHLLRRSDEVARSGALALCICSKSDTNKQAIQKYGALPLLENLLHSKNDALLVPVVGTLQECASDPSYREAIRNSGMIQLLVETLQRSKNTELLTHCANAIFKCAHDEQSRNLVHKSNGLEPLANLLEVSASKDLLAAATGAIWYTAQSKENVTALIKMGAVKKLVSLMDNQPEEVLVNVVGAIGACAQAQEGRAAIREASGIMPLVQLLKRTDPKLLVNVTRAIGACAHDNDCMAVIDRMDGVRLLWSLLKNPTPSVQASAAWAISPCIEHAKDAGEMVRSFVGGLELIVSLLKSDNTEVLASVCGAIAKIAQDEENLAVITDHGVVSMLAKLTHTKNDQLKKFLAEAIAKCCPWGANRVAFGAAKSVAPLVKFLKSNDPDVHRATTLALHQLSMDPENCIAMHENGVVPLLLDLVGASDETLQEAAAGTIGNIRKLALASDKAAFI